MAANTAQLTRALEETAKDHGPGVFGLVTEGGEVVFAQSVGVADLNDPRPIDADDQFSTGSLTKLYTAALVLRLAADGAFGLTDTVEQWAPGLVPGGEAMTVDVLLRLRSGLPDYTMAMIGDPPDFRILGQYIPAERLVEIALTVDDRIEPDTQYRYSTTDYTLLELIVERASGRTFAEQISEVIFRPHNLVNTSLPTTDPFIRGHHARGYMRYAPDMPYEDCTRESSSATYSSGSVVSTARDVARFMDALFGGAILDPASLALMKARSHVVDEYRSRGLGVVRYDFGTGSVSFGHTGGVPGYSCVAMRTESGRSVVLWQNGLDFHDVLSSDAAFIQAALSG